MIFSHIEFFSSTCFIDSLINSYQLRIFILGHSLSFSDYLRVFFLENNYYLGYITAARSKINKKARIAV